MRLMGLLGLLMFYIVLGSVHAENCMWDQSCEDERLNIDFCGNGVCDSFESKESCLEDCGTMVDSVADEVDTAILGEEDKESGIFGVIHRSSFGLLLKFFFGVVVAVVVAVVLIALYNRIVETIERED